MTWGTKLPWGLICGLGALQLLRPLLSMAGVYEGTGPWGPLLLTALLAIVWVGVVVARRVAQPVLTLALAGAAYGVFAIALNLVARVFLPDAQGFSPAGAVSIVLTNVVWGALLGLVALGLLLLFRRRGGGEPS
ncbi:hypothetical protein [Salinactinospora qingdaonensis]|uniref:Uncharacterized protein n=1 Tax=Salinactinospora qingdaonensis TaxID=702744 RepID=A0ABP7GGA0_9ACTN